MMNHPFHCCGESLRLFGKREGISYEALTNATILRWEIGRSEQSHRITKNTHGLMATPTVFTTCTVLDPIGLLLEGVKDARLRKQNL